jgi:hypothetical protein
MLTKLNFILIYIQFKWQLTFWLYKERKLEYSETILATRDVYLMMA